MQLFYSVNSPYARKCRVVLLEKGLKAELVEAPPLENPPELIAANPLGKVPALVTDDGQHLNDSPLICEYLDSLNDNPRLLPGGLERYSVLSIAALADGVMDMTVECVLQSRRPESQRWPDWIARRHEGIKRTVEFIAGKDFYSRGGLNMAHINTAIMLSYLDFRLPKLDWRRANPALATWHKGFEARSSMQATRPALA